jgi:hypothetical protein
MFGANRFVEVPLQPAHQMVAIRQINITVNIVELDNSSIFSNKFYLLEVVTERLRFALPRSACPYVL